MEIPVDQHISISAILLWRMFNAKFISARMIEIVANQYQQARTYYRGVSLQRTQAYRVESLSLS
jgi:hypothetical protein